MISVQLSNTSGAQVDEEAAVALARDVLAAEGIEDGEVGLVFVGAQEMRELKRTHLGIDELADVLAFPIDGRDALPDGVPRQLGDAVICPEVVGADWQEPLVHALLHLLGHEHGPAMAARERAHRR